MTDAAQSLGVDASGLRERLTQQSDAPQKASSSETAHETVRALNEQEAKGDKDEKDRKTFGRTPDGTGEYFQCSPRYDSTLDRCNIVSTQLSAMP
jgi:phosphatidylethanolamine N-methyltransferase